MISRAKKIIFVAIEIISGPPEIISHAIEIISGTGEIIPDAPEMIFLAREIISGAPGIIFGPREAISDARQFAGAARYSIIACQSSWDMCTRRSWRGAASSSWARVRVLGSGATWHRPH